MLRISKRDKPHCLETTRAEYLRVHEGMTKAAWADLSGECKQAMREAAFREQGGLCAYCMSRLSGTHAADSARPELGGMTLEHFDTRHARGDRTLDWDNLLGVCPGIVVGGTRENDETGEAHCDRHRGWLPPGQQSLSYNPAHSPPDVGDLYRFEPSTGRIVSHDPAATRDIERLQLNRRRLVRNRLAVFDEIRTRLTQNLTGTRLRELGDRYTRRGRDGRLLPYAGVGIAYLHKKLRARGLL